MGSQSVVARHVGHRLLVSDDVLNKWPMGVKPPFCLTTTVENEDHCEFTHLRNFLTRTHLQDLIETTAMIHYEAFRSNQLMKIKEGNGSGRSPTSAP